MPVPSAPAAAAIPAGAQSTASPSPATGSSSSASLPPENPSSALGSTLSLQPANKKACLACRARKTRCDGVEPCRLCIKKQIECSFIPSRRGGSKPKKDRVPRRDAAASIAAAGHVSISSSEAAGVDSFVSKLQGFMHSLLSPTGSDAPPSTSVLPTAAADTASVPIDFGLPNDDSWRVRHYASGEEILTAYYVHIYAYEPFLPPPTVISPSALLSTLAPPSVSDPAHPTSPLLLAILASLVLIPAPDDPEPRSNCSKSARREASARWADKAERRVDEMMRDAGRSGDSLVPIEVIQTLSMCGLYEWAQHGNVPTMRTRQSVALQLSMDAGLHCLDDESSPLSQKEAWWREMGRRTFWLAFGRVLLGTMTSGLSPVIAPYDPRITIHLPKCAAGLDVWIDQMEALRLAVYTKDFVDTVKHVDGPSAHHPYFDAPGSVKASDRGREYERLDRILTNLIRESERKVVALECANSTRSGPPDPELALCINFRRSALMCHAMTFINLHRKAAFNNLGGVGVFTKRMCGLPSISDGAQEFKKFASLPKTISSCATLAAEASVPTGSLRSFAGALPSGGFDEFLAEALVNWTPPANISDGDLLVTESAPTLSLDAGVWPEIPTWSTGNAAGSALEPPPAVAFSGAESLAKVRAGVETVARLEVINEALLLSAHGRATATLPFCACELVTAAYCLLVLALTLQASDTVRTDRAAVQDELEGIWSSCWTILRGLRSFGDVWDGLDGFADELQAALNASLGLCGLPARDWSSAS